MTYLIIFLATSGTALAIIYSSLDYFGFIDKWTKHIIVKDSLSRLNRVTGYPRGWIYNDPVDHIHFDAIFRIIKKNNKDKVLQDILKDGLKPSMITTGGEPVPVNGIPNDWPQEERFVYTDNHPIILTFNVHRNIDSKGKALKVCTLGELKGWVKKNKQKYNYLVGGLVIGLIAIALTIWQLKIS